MELGHASTSNARRLGIDLDQWTAELAAGSREDPRSFSKQGAQIARRLQRGKVLRLAHPNGTDLTLNLRGRPAEIRDGILTPKMTKTPFGNMVNFPGGIVAIPLDDSSANGTVIANRPSYLGEGVATGGKWTFKNGRLTSAKFGKGDVFFQEPFAKGKKGKDRPGYLSIGLNPGIKNVPDLEDAERGTVLVTVGTNQFFGGSNGSDFMGWVAVGGGTLTIDGRAIIDRGEIIA